MKKEDPRLRAAGKKTPKASKNEKFVKKQFVGITAEYINRISRLSGIDFEFREYKSYSEFPNFIC